MVDIENKNKFLKKYLNPNLFLVISLYVFSIINFLVGSFSIGELLINSSFIFVLLIIIVYVQGVYKHE